MTEAKITDVREIEKYINYILACNCGMIANEQHRDIIEQIVYPALEEAGCDMRLAPLALDDAIAKGEAMRLAQMP